MWVVQATAAFVHKGFRNEWPPWVIHTRGFVFYGSFLKFGIVLFAGNLVNS